MQDLTFRQRLFVEYYIGEANGNAAQAARRAGYRWPEKQGPQQLAKTSVRSAIESRVSDVAMAANAVLARLSDIAAGSLEDYIAISEDGGFSFDMRKAKRRGKLHLLKKLKNKKETRWEKTGDRDEKELVITEHLEIELHDPQNALHKLGLYHGLFKDRVDITSNGESVKTHLYLPDNERDPDFNSGDIAEDHSAPADPGTISGEQG